MRTCTQCPLRCGSDRETEDGVCGVRGMKIAKFALHPFEEPPISFKNGSGAIFFCGCSLRCAFCQNFELSRNRRGKEISPKDLADIFKRLEDMGAENINLVNPTHYLSDIEEAVSIYRPSVPIVWNSHGYERLESLERADRFVDIWLPDFKFMDPKISKRYTGKENYSKYAVPAVRFMSEKKRVVREDGKMLSGCIVRHLILPLCAYDSVEVVKFVSTLSKDVTLSLMSQYTPFGEIDSFPELKRRITRREYDAVVSAAEEAGIENLLIQDFSSASEEYIPQWDF